MNGALLSVDTFPDGSDQEDEPGSEVAVKVTVVAPQPPASTSTTRPTTRPAGLSSVVHLKTSTGCSTDG